MLADDSPLKSLPVRLDLRQLRLLGGLRFALETAGHTFARLHDRLETWCLANPTPEDPSDLDIPGTMIDAWGFVDAVNRFRDVGSVLYANGHQLSTDYDRYRKIRNHIQHLRSRLQAPEHDERPPYGSLAWVFRRSAALVEGYVLVPGTVHRAKDIPVMRNRLSGTRLDFIELTAFGTTVSLSDTYSSLLAVVSDLEEELREQIADDEDTLGADLLIRLHLPVGGQQGPD